MSKRKAGVKDIIYELDNEDIEISSEDEVREAKINRLNPKGSPNLPQSKLVIEDNCGEVINIESSIEEGSEIISSPNKKNGGKISLDMLPDSNCSNSNKTKIIDLVETEMNITNKLSNDCTKTTIFNEDIVIDSPASNSDLGVVGCENRTPLVTVRFKDKNLAKNYKEKVKTFLLNLIKLHDEDGVTGSETETDLEVDIWPEDVIDDIEENDSQVEDSLFFVDTAPGMDTFEDIPTYRQNSTLISNIPKKEQTPPRIFRRGPTCFNCDGPHPLRDCQLPRNNLKIAEKRKNMTVKVGRYHVEDEQKYGHLVPGRISGQLRHALGLKRHELPMYIYRMRLLGYPPGWLEEARISHSGISMFDSTGNAILDPEEEEGELCEPGCKDKYDIKKILDFPGFNVATSSRYKEEAHLFGLPPMSEQDSKIAMLQMLAPNAMKAYKRKKLTFFPSTITSNSTQEGQTEMELDSGDEVAEFPSVPPLPDEAPPPPPPPPDSPPPPLVDSPPLQPDSPPLPPDRPSLLNDNSLTIIDPPPLETEKEAEGKTEDSADEKSADDLELVEIIQVPDIPIPEDVLITIDDDDKSQSSGLNSPTLDDLEEKKRLLLSALNVEVTSVSSVDISVVDIDTEPEVNDKVDEQQNDAVEKDKDETKTEDKQVSTEENNLTNKETDIDSGIDTKQTIDSVKVNISTPKASPVLSEKRETSDSDSDPKTPDIKGHVKTTLYGTPVMNIASSYTMLPSDEKFSKDISDVINFENLPNSTGKYKKISKLLKKVKGEVDRIQES